jgi:TRAP-type C4-dicarboxylate transport system substrate-binding protein
MTSMPMSFAIGATVVKIDSLKKINAEDTKALEEIGKASSKKLRKTIRKANEDAKTTMTRKGITVVQTPVEMVSEFEKNAQEVWKDLTGKVYSKEELEMVLKYRDEYRAKKGGGKAATPATPAAPAKTPATPAAPAKPAAPAAPAAPAKK